MPKTNLAAALILAARSAATAKRTLPTRHFLCVPLRRPSRPLRLNPSRGIPNG